MSEKLGPMTFGEQGELVFLGKEIVEGKNYSEKVAAEIDKEVEKFIRDAQKTAEKILKNRKSKLIQIAQRLIKKETIERKEFEELMKK
ncbi:MAG: cell division protein FtsH, partial [Patescibacteria group bacterium]